MELSRLIDRLKNNYESGNISECRISLLLIALSFNADILADEEYNHDLKHLLFKVNFVRNPMGMKYTQNDYEKTISIFTSTIKMLESINNPKIDTSSVIHKDILVDSRIIDDFISITMYTHCLYQMNERNTKRLYEHDFGTTPFVEQVLALMVFFQDQSRLLQQNASGYIQENMITGLEFAIADKPVEYAEDAFCSISDSLESELEGMNELIHYLYYRFRKEIKTQVLEENIDFKKISPYENQCFLQYLYVAAQRRHLCRTEEAIRYGYNTLGQMCKLEDGREYYFFSLEDDKKYMARKLGLLRREYQYQQHAFIFSLDEKEIESTHSSLSQLSRKLLELQSGDKELLDFSGFCPNKVLFQEAEGFVAPKVRTVETLTKEFYLNCQVSGVKISDLLCTYKYLSTLSEIQREASKQLINHDDPSTYIKEISLVNISYLVSELARLYDFDINYSAKLVDRFTFHERDNRLDDIFAQPLIKVSKTQVILSQAMLNQVNLDRVIERQFIRFEEDVSQIGHVFEREFIQSLTQGYKENSLDSKRKAIPNFFVNTNRVCFTAFDGKDIEFDVIAMLGDYLILTELKAIMTSYDFDALESRKRNIKEATNQLIRRAESIQCDWEKIKSMVSIELPEKPVDQEHIIMVACTDAFDYTPLKEQNVFVTDASTYLKYFTNPYIDRVIKAGKSIEIQTLKQLWSKGYPEAREFMQYLTNPATIHPLCDCVEKITIPGPLMDEDDSVVVYEDYAMVKNPMSEYFM